MEPDDCSSPIEPEIEDSPVQEVPITKDDVRVLEQLLSEIRPSDSETESYESLSESQPLEGAKLTSDGANMDVATHRDGISLKSVTNLSLDGAVGSSEVGSNRGDSGDFEEKIIEMSKRQNSTSESESKSIGNFADAQADPEEIEGRGKSSKVKEILKHRGSSSSSELIDEAGSGGSAALPIVTDEDGAPTHEDFQSIKTELISRLNEASDELLKANQVVGDMVVMETLEEGRKVHESKEAATPSEGIVFRQQPYPRSEDKDSPEIQPAPEDDRLAITEISSQDSDHKNKSADDAKVVMETVVSLQKGKKTGAAEKDTPGQDSSATNHESSKGIAKDVLEGDRVVLESHTVSSKVTVTDDNGTEYSLENASPRGQVTELNVRETSDEPEQKESTKIQHGMDENVALISGQDNMATGKIETTDNNPLKVESSVSVLQLIDESLTKERSVSNNLENSKKDLSVESSAEE